MLQLSSQCRSLFLSITSTADAALSCRSLIVALFIADSTPVESDAAAVGRRQSILSTVGAAPVAR
jgi:hypothetical protein